MDNLADESRHTLKLPYKDDHGIYLIKERKQERRHCRQVMVLESF